MAKRIIPSALETHLVNNEPFDYAHLIKFERPFNPFQGAFRENENRFVFLTDGARDVEFLGDTYHAHQVVTVGNYSETTQAKATNMNLTVPGEYLGLNVTLSAELTGNNAARSIDGTCTLTAADSVVDGIPFSWVGRGFKIGDKISVKKQNGTLWAGGTDAASVVRDAVSEKIFIISGITDTVLTLKQTGIDGDDSSFLLANSGNKNIIVSLLNPEIIAATLDNGTQATVNTTVLNSNTITLTEANSKIRLGQLVSGVGIETDSIVTSISGTSLKLSQTQTSIRQGTKLVFTNPSFVNRKVEVFKAFLNPDTGAIIGSPVLTFKGFITSTNIQEAPGSSRVQWNMTSHWGDFSQIAGRLTSDEVHRALDSNGFPQKLLAVKPQYATDLGYLHSDMSLNTIGTYQTSETRYRNKEKRRGGLAGLVGMKKYYVEEYQVEVDHDVDLSIYLQGKFLPVVYGVMRVPGIPVFADTLNNDPNTIYVAYAISEGEIQGIYNMYIDGNSLLCTDEADATTRGTGATGNTALTCYGRMDRGNVLGGTNIGGTLSFTEWLHENDLFEDYQEALDNNRESRFESMYQDFLTANENNINNATAADLQQGIGHEISASISSPHDIDFTFHQGREFQKASSILATVAAGDNFKRQNSYYSGNEQYWSSDHTLLDTAYVVVKFQIDADSTTVPEMEYVVKGKALECFNYDGTFVHDPVYQASTNATYGGEADSHTNFKEGDIVSVETSFDGNTWQSETGFRILHKYPLVTTRGETQYRFILDNQPNLGVKGVTSIEITNPGSGFTSNPTISLSGGGGSGATVSALDEQRAGGIAGLFGKKIKQPSIENGKLKRLYIQNPGSGYTSAPTVSISGGGGSGATAVAKIEESGVPIRKFVRLKSTSNKYWHMLPFNSGIQDTPTNLLASNNIEITNASTDSNGVLTLTLTNAAKTKFLQLYPNTTASSDTSDAYIQLSGTLPNVLKGAKDKTLRVIGLNGSSTNLSIHNHRFTPSQSNLHTNLRVQPADAFYIGATHEHRSNTGGHNVLTSNELVGSTFEIFETEERRRIESVDTSNNIIRLEAPLLFTPNITTTTNNNDTYVIQGKGRDLRSSTNPAIQTVDLLINRGYGKGLDIEEDLDIASIRESANLCDTRADVTVQLASSANVTAGDIYKLDYSGNHVASGKVLKTGSGVTSVVFTDVSGKFLRSFAPHIRYNTGDIIVRYVGSTPYYYQYTGGGGYETEPTHTSSHGGTNWTVITSISLTKVSGSGSSTLAMSTAGDGVGYSLYDGDFVKYWRYIGWYNSEQFNVTRHQTNFYFDTSKPLFDNVNAILSHYNGILSYSNGKYVLSVETGEEAPTATITDGVQTNPEYIDESDIIGTISLNDNSLKNAKNTIKASLNDPQNHFNTRSVSFFNGDFLKADRGIQKTGSFPFTGITSYYNARINVEKELIQSRFSKEISFTIGPRGLLLKPGEVISLTYEPFGFDKKLFRIENLTYNSNCNTSVKAREYDDSIYAITPQRASLAQRAASGLGQEIAVPSKPTSVSVSNNKPGIITLNWTNGTGFKEATDSTEIWRKATTNNRTASPAATLVAVVDNATTFNDALGTAGTFYYWLRHRRNAKATSSQAVRVVHSEFHAGDTAGAQALALVPSPQLDVDVSSAQIRFNASNALTPTGTAQDVPLTATLRNITASNVTFTLVNADTTTTATDVTFTNNSASVVDSSAPFTATIDASSFSHNTTNRFVKVTCTDSNSNETFTELIPVTVSKDGSSGSIGQDAKAIKLLPSTHVVSYSAVGGESTTVTFTTETQGTSEFSGTANYQFLVGGVLKATNTTGTFTLADADEPAANASVQVLVKLFDGTPSGSPEASDSVTIFGVKDGSDGVTAFLTNNSHVVSTASDGSGASFTNAGGTFKVFVGSTDITTATSGGQQVTYAVNSETGVDVAINSTTGVYTVASMSADQGVAVFRASIPANLSPDGTAFTIDQTYSISKSKTGTQGASGLAGKTVRLTSNEYAINYDENGNLVSGQGTGSAGSEIFTLSADAKNFSDARLQYLENGSQIQAFTTATTEAVNIPQTVFTTPKVYQVNVKEDGGSIEATDSLAVFAVQEGKDAHTVLLTNPTHAFPAANDGTVSGSDLAVGATEFRVFRGATQLTFNASGGGAGTNTYKIGESSGVDLTLSNIAGSFSTVSNQRKFTPSSVTGDSGSATFTITAGGQTFTAIYTYSKSKKGDAGTNTAEVRIYKKQSTLLPIPAHPDNTTTYTFSSRAWPGSGNQDDGWSTNSDAGSGNFTYMCKATAVGANGAATATIQVADWSDPKLDITQEGRVRKGVLAFYDNWTEGTTLPSINTTYDDDANGTSDTGMRYDFDNETLVLGSVNSGWSTSFPGHASLPYAYATISINESTLGGTQTISANVQGRGTWSRLPPGGIRIQPDNTNRNIRIKLNDDILGPTVDIANLYNDQITLTASNGTVTLNNASSTNNTFTKSSIGLGSVDNLSAGAIRAGTTKSDVGLSNVDNLTAAAIRAGTTADDVGLGNVDNLGAAAIRAGTTADDVGLGNVTNESKATMFTAPTFTGTVTGVTKDHVGLPNTADGATVGARMGSGGTGNLFLEDGSTKATDATLITSQGTSFDTSNVNTVASTNLTPAVTAAQNNVAGVIQGLSDGTQAVTANAITTGTINTSLLKLDELFLPTSGTGSSGAAATFGSSMTQVSLGDIGTGPGFYMGTVSIEIVDAQNDDIRGASLHIDLKSGFSTVYTKYWPIGIKEGNQYYDTGDQFGDSADLPVMHLEFAYFHTANTTLNLFVNGDSNDSATTTVVKARAVKFGAETVTFNTSSFTSSVTNATASSTQDSGTITVGGFISSKSVNLSGDSSALVSVNGGSFVNAASVGNITAGQTLELRLTASSTAGTTRSATVEVGGTSATFSVTTAGTYSSGYGGSGSGGSGSGGGGFQNNTELR